MQHKGILMVMSGFSGAGKGTIVKRMLEKYPDQYKLSISATTRKPREGETHGKEYFFLTKEEFIARMKEDGFVEWAEYVGNYYGTPKAYIEEELAKGSNIILEIEMQGALEVRKKFKDALLLFVTPPDYTTLKERLVNRGTEDMETIRKRLNRAVKETGYIEQYNNVIVNNDVEEAADEIHNIVMNEMKLRHKHAEFIANFIEQYNDDNE
ncbi:MAG: guanylate kinase [Lachnospiraceae bacterium]|nr:guanylate kinase [Lachnospiraceae bacterium]